MWNEIDAKLPNRKITVYGPPTTSGTRDSFDEMVMESASKNLKLMAIKRANTKLFVKMVSLSLRVKMIT